MIRVVGKNTLNYNSVVFILTMILLGRTLVTMTLVPASIISPLVLPSTRRSPISIVPDGLKAESVLPSAPSRISKEPISLTRPSIVVFKPYFNHDLFFSDK